MHANPDRLICVFQDDPSVVDEEIRFLQSLLGAEPDGVIGPLTRKAARRRGGHDTGSNRKIFTALKNLKGDLMAVKQEVLDALNALKTRVDNFVKKHSEDIAAKIAEAVAAKKAEMEAADATMDAADFDEFMAGIGEIAKAVPDEEFDPSANAGG